MIPSRRNGAGKHVRIPRVLALALLLGVCLCPARDVRADNRVRILFDDIEDAYTPLTTEPSPPTDGCRPAVDDNDDDGCVTEAAGAADDGDP